MKVTAHFDDIHKQITNSINKAKYNIFVAVAWITDQTLWNILQKKAEDGVTVQIILIQDEINKRNQNDLIKFVKAGGQIFWDDHHHKFCVVDVKTLITGSYNWTYMGNNRHKRENIVIIEDDRLICEQFSDEFKLLLKQSDKYILKAEKEIVTIIKEVVKEVEVEKFKFKTVYLNKDGIKNIKPTFIARFNSPYIICSNCNTTLNKNKICQECKKVYKYDSNKNEYITYD